MNPSYRLLLFLLMFFFVIVVPRNAYAGSPAGYHDFVSCSGNTITVRGWTCDDDNYGATLEVQTFVNDVYGGSGQANVSRPDLIPNGYQCGGNINHGFAYTLPAKYPHGTHSVKTYGMNIGSGSNSLLRLSPRNVTCLPPPQITSPTTSLPCGSTSMTFSWNPVSGASSYAARADDGINDVKDSRNNCPAGTRHALCLDFYTNTSVTFTVVPGRTYGVWVHSLQTNGSFSEAQIQMVHVPVCPTATAIPPTNTPIPPTPTFTPVPPTPTFTPSPTPVPTNTPTPTPTNTPTPTATPTPLPPTPTFTHTPTPSPTFTPVPTFTPTPGRYADCNVCGYCFSKLPPDNYQKCMECMYPGMTPEQTLLIDPVTNRPPAPAKGKYFSQIGCIDSAVGSFTDPRATGGVLNYVLNNLVFPAAGVLSLTSLIRGAFLLMTSQINPEQLLAGKRWVYGALIGAVFTFTSMLIVQDIAADILRIPGFN